MNLRTFFKIKYLTNFLNGNLLFFKKMKIDFYIDNSRNVSIRILTFILICLVSSCRDPVVMSPPEISKNGLCHFLDENRYDKFLQDKLIGTILEKKEIRNDNLFGCEFTIERRDKTKLPLTMQLFTKPISEKSMDWSGGKLKDLSALGFKHPNGKVDNYVEIKELPFFAVWCNENKAIWWVIDQNNFLISYPLQANAPFTLKEAIESAKFIHDRISSK